MIFIIGALGALGVGVNPFKKKTFLFLKKNNSNLIELSPPLTPLTPLSYRKPIIKENEEKLPTLYFH
jgi:hypothetical protein